MSYKTSSSILNDVLLKVKNNISLPDSCLLVEYWDFVFEKHFIFF